MCVNVGEHFATRKVWLLVVETDDITLQGILAQLPSVHLGLKGLSPITCSSASISCMDS
jgi:hypothetical protein